MVGSSCGLVVLIGSAPRTPPSASAGLLGAAARPALASSAMATAASKSRATHVASRLRNSFMRASQLRQSWEVER
eukprot:13715148-Alexandrium_andersonii.AAC.1